MAQFDAYGCTLHLGDCRAVLATLPAESVQCVVTSPPYWALRDYGVEGQLGMEPTPEAYLETMVDVFRGVRRVLRQDGTLWLNMGDGYANDGKWGGSTGGKHAKQLHGSTGIGRSKRHTGLKPKDLIGMPWRLALALQADGWWLRSDCVWAKPSAMPESATDRPTKVHEYVFLLTKAARYYYDGEAVREPAATAPHAPGYRNGGAYAVGPMDRGGHSQREQPERVWGAGSSRNLRSVWTIPTQAYHGAHFATFPEKLVSTCLLPGTSHKGCCAECGAPWGRMVEDSDGYAQFEATERERKGRGMRSSEMQTLGLTVGTANKSVSASRRTTGWEPTCECGADVVPCTVLDPFAGSGTVGVVCRRMGLRFVGIELNPEYLDMAGQRISNPDAGKPEPVDENQGALFDGA